MGNVLSNSDALLQHAARNTLPEAVLSQVVLMTAVSGAAIVTFNLLRPQNKIVYEPKVKYHQGSKPPPKISDSIFGWIPPLIHTKESEIVDKLGLDAAIFLRFLRLCRWLFTFIAIIACAVCIPINYTQTQAKIDSLATPTDSLLKLTIRDVQGLFLWAHIAVLYIITGLVIFFVDQHWKQVVRLRMEFFRSPEYLSSFYARTLAVMHVPKQLQSDDGIKSIFESVQVPYPTTSVHIGRRVGKLPELIEYHNNTVKELEKVLVRYLKGGKLAKNRPTITTGARWGCGGRKQDAIDYYTKKLKLTEAAIEDYRNQIDNRKAENYGFASMAAVPYAHVVGNLLKGKHPKGTTISLAPMPKDIIWENMNKTDRELAGKRLTGFWLLALVAFFNTLPLFVLSVLANLASLAPYVNFLADWSVNSRTSFAVVSGVLPPAVSAIFGFILPVIMRRLSKYMGALTHSYLDRAVIARYFAFLIISQLVIFTLIGVLFNSIKNIVISVGKKTSFGDIIHSLDTLPATINTTYIDQSSYWLTFFPLRGFLVIFDLAQIINVFLINLKTRILGRTPRDIREWTKPPFFPYAIIISNLLYSAAVGLVFAPLAPLVVAASAIVFWLSSWVYKYQLMFVFVSKVESGGRLWNVVINRLLFCVFLMQCLFTLTIGLQYSSAHFRSFVWTATIPPMILLGAYKLYINRTHLAKFHHYMPTEEELRNAQVHSERSDAKGNRLVNRFGHPALQADLFTPMLHAKMMPLLRDVYSGNIGQDRTKMDEYGGQRMDAQIVAGGVKIAAIDQRDLEYDPAQYRRDMAGENWDARSIAPSNLMSDTASVNMYGKPPTSAATYDNYLANGSEIELRPFNSRVDEQPLLAAQQPWAMQHQHSSTPSLPMSMYGNVAEGQMREAPIHRPQGQDYQTSYPPSYPPVPQHAPQMSYGSDHARAFSPAPQQQQGYYGHQQQSPSYGHQQRSPSYANQMQGGYDGRGGY